MRKGHLFSMLTTLIYSVGLFAQMNYKIAELPFNTPAKEMAPALYKNSLVFCSDRRNDILVSYMDQNNNPLTNLYQVEKKASGRFGPVKPVSKTLNSALFEGPSVFSHDGNTIFFTRTLDITKSLNNKARTDTTFGIFIAEYRNGKWDVPRPFNFNSSSYNTGYPFITDNGLQLYFCSDAPGGYGGMDIYVSNLNNGQWSSPENLGPAINTDKNEVFPYLQRSGRLFFSSRGHKSTNDLDILYSDKKDGVWQTPVILPEPFNTTNDDYGLIFNTSSDTGYFVSDRNGSQDIFAAYSTLPVFSQCTMQQEDDYCFVFYESNNSEIDTALYVYEWDLGDGAKMRSIEAEHCYEGPGTYEVQLNIIDKLTDDVMVSQATYSILVERIEQPYIQCVDTVYSGEEVKFSGKNSFYKNFQIENYYWDFDDGSSATGVETLHRFSIPGTYKVRLGITDINNDFPKAGQKSCVTRNVVVLETKN